MPKYKNILEISKRARKRRLENTNSVYPVPPNIAENVSSDESDVPEPDPEPEPVLDLNATVDRDETAIQFLRSWTAKFQIQKNAVTDLLKFLKFNGFPNLPSDYRALLQSPKNKTIMDMFPGHYSHIGVKKALDYYVRHSTTPIAKLRINVNVDGVPISGSTSKSFWLVLIQISGGNCSRTIYVAGIYMGDSKPLLFTDFLEHFVSEMISLSELYMVNDRVIPVEIGCVICDAPARNSCLGNKSYNGHFGCGRCTEKGEKLHYRMVITEIKDLEKRTNESFRNKSQPEHHKYDSTFLKLNMNMVSQFPLDYLHTVNLGVVKKILAMIIYGDERSDIRPAPKQDIKNISERLIRISNSQPSEFQRKCRTLSEFHHFKATEFRNLILYILPVAALNILREDVYNNMMFLHAALVIIVDPIICKSHSDIAQKCLESFVSSFKTVYGPEHIVYNVHSLLHIVDDVMVHGSLDSYSAFPFESYECN